MPEGSIATRRQVSQLNRDLTARPPVVLPDGGTRLIEPGDGVTVFDPPGAGAGWWVGAPSALWTGDRYYLSYRIRHPQPERGCQTQIAMSADGVRFEPIWSARHQEFASPSIERSALVRVDQDVWRLYVSYVDGSDGRWRIDMLEASSPTEFDPASRRSALTAAATRSEGVKDPWVARIDGGWGMIISYAPGLPGGTVGPARLHDTQDIFNTGLTKSVTGFATSEDGLTWRLHGTVLQPAASGWDRFAARLSTVIGTGDGWIGLYDGAAVVAQNYEEQCSVVISDDLRHWRRADGQRIIGASGGAGTVRYAEAVQTSDWIRFYYEYTRPDGSHELRTSLLRMDDTTDNTVTDAHPPGEKDRS